jgi:hypothetical protein
LARRRRSFEFSIVGSNILSTQQVRTAASIAASALLLLLFANGGARAANQTATLSPVMLGGPLPYAITVTPYDFGDADLPTLHSFAAGELDGKWVLLAGRTNGLHGFSPVNPSNNFPAQSQNREVWVVDPVAKQSWHRSLADAAAGLTTAELNSLTPVNTQFTQVGDRLYMTGGYGVEDEPPSGTPVSGTFDTLSALDLPGLAAWAMGGAGTAKQHIRQANDPMFQVTGGDLYEMGGRMHLVFGQNYTGSYVPGLNGAYTQQVRSFNIVDDGTTLGFANATATAPDDDYRRRDLNIVPAMRPAGGGQFAEGLVVLSGVFTPSTGAWTVPVEIDAAGQPSMDDPADPNAFKQGMNGYHSAKLGLFSEATGAMHEILFGGISLQYFDAASGQILQDNNMPFVNDITSIVIDAVGNYSQHRIGEYPVLTDGTGQRLRFGANAELFLADGVAAFDNGVLKLDKLAGPTTVGYIFGGLVANGPHTRSVPGVTSIASNIIFQVVVTPVPEPASWLVVLTAAVLRASTTLQRARRSCRT